MKFKRNMSDSDRIIRFIVAIVLLPIYFVAGVRGFWGIIILIVSTIFLLTSLSSFCPLYKAFSVKKFNYDE